MLDSHQRKGMEALINTGDEYQRYQSKVRNTKVPKLLILDKDKKIILKVSQLTSWMKF
ncbi:MAG: hypothetical protein IPJ13_25185 [Saprospiraceae bacterium]|nr:hypothetical protein [Saprospiraceae bacterium]